MICQETVERGALILVLGGEKDWAQKVNIPINFKEWLRICHIKWTLRAYLALKCDDKCFWSENIPQSTLSCPLNKAKEKQNAKLILDLF